MSILSSLQALGSASPSWTSLRAGQGQAWGKLRRWAAAQPKRRTLQTPLPLWEPQDLEMRVGRSSSIYPLWGPHILPVASLIPCNQLPTATSPWGLPSPECQGAAPLPPRPHPEHLFCANPCMRSG